MGEQRMVFRTLVGYFFARFFENDVLQSDGDQVTTVVRAAAMAAAPGLLIAFFLQNQYPARSTWGRIEDHYFFVLYSLVAMAGIAVFEWEMLFPDRLDFLVLSPLPLGGLQMLGAKAAALGGFLALFLFAANVLSAGMLPLVSKGSFWIQAWAQVLAVASAGIFGALTILAAGGVLLCVLPPTLFRVVSPLLRMLVVTVLGLMLVHYARFGDVLDKVLVQPAAATRWVPSFWFLGVYERVQHGTGAAPFALSMMQRGIHAIAAAFVVVIVSYPLAWSRMRRMAIEGEGMASGGRPGLFAFLFSRAVRVPASRGVVNFIGQTITRDSRYQVYLAMYWGIGLALAIACVVTFSAHGATLRPEILPAGLRAVVPLLLFWTVAGLRMAFALPMTLAARWIFRVTGADRATCVAAARKWALVCALGMLALLLPLLFASGLERRAVLVQAASGACLCVLMVEGLLFSDAGIPFTQPRSPDKTNLPLTLTLFIGVLPLFVMGMVRAEWWLERRPTRLLLVIAAVPLLRWLVGLMRINSQAQLEDGDEAEGQFQLLGLGTE